MRWGGRRGTITQPRDCPLACRHAEPRMRLHLEPAHAHAAAPGAAHPPVLCTSSRSYFSGRLRRRSISNVASCAARAGTAWACFEGPALVRVARYAPQPSCGLPAAAAARRAALSGVLQHCRAGNL